MSSKKNAVTNENNKQYLLITLHDVTPRFMPEIEKIISDFNDYRIQPVNLCIVPNYHNNFDLRNNPDFISFLRPLIDAGSEPLLHGLSHYVAEDSKKNNNSYLRGAEYLKHKIRVLLNGHDEAEFLSLGYDNAFEMLSMGKNILDQVKISVSGFIAPCWYISNDSVDAAKNCNIKYIDCSDFIIDISKSKTLPAKKLEYVYKSRILDLAFLVHNEYIMHNFLKSKSVLNVPLHPQDIRNHNPYRRAIDDIIHLISNGAEPITYSKFLETG